MKKKKTKTKTKQKNMLHYKRVYKADFRDYVFANPDRFLFFS